MRPIILCAVLAFANAQLLPETTFTEFQNFKTKYGKQYTDDIEEQFRFEIFSSNFEYIMRHNIAAANGKHGFTLSVNKFADMTNKEFRSFYNGFRMGFRSGQTEEFFVNGGAFAEPLPTTVDWRTKGVVTAIKNQEQCGSCWAFSAVASLEGQHALTTGKLVSLSEQNLVDCSTSEGNYGCEGGFMDYAFQYVEDAGGIDTETSYPYKAIDERCMFNKSNVGATLKSFTDIQSGSESSLQAAVANVGPISVAIDASALSFQFYKSGVYDEPNCSSSMLDHGVTAVGYGTQNNTAYWLVKNSWGTDWGDKGYILMSRNKNNQCGIATMSSYPNV